jgi:glycosyltransferase involved in cell wall biosynthesis
MAPLGPPLFERLLLLCCKRVILDVDDALHISDKESSRLVPRLLRDCGKFSRLAASYTAVVCGNTYLAEFYRRHADNVQIIPTVVEPSRYETVQRNPSLRVRIGWIGTPLSAHHLDLLYSPLMALSRERNIEFVIVGLNQPLRWNAPFIRYLKWELANELDYLAQFDIGVMPLQDSLFAQGKCAFKLIQYMATAMAVVASPIGANREVVHHGVNGFLAGTEGEWYQSLRTLIDDPDLRNRMGECGRDLVRRSYSVDSAWPRYSAILRDGLREETACTVTS